MSIVQQTWIYGTAFDLFASLYVLHEPDRFGIRAAWAAGVRSRLSAEDRETLEQAEAAIWILRSLNEPKDSATALWALRQIPAGERLATLGLRPSLPAGIAEIYRAVAARGAWEPADLESLRVAYQDQGSPPRPKILEMRLAVWAQTASFGERYLKALQSYQEVFFSEEETRIGSALQIAVAQAQARAAQIPVETLIEELSRGVRLENDLDWQELVLVPSYWISPLVVFEELGSGQELFLFGARPAEVSLVPGELVPESMLRVIKTLGDPTRLRILRYLAQESITPAELARRLRLRAPTVTHHLNLLRLAGLVYLTLGEKGQRRYATRPEAVEEAFAALRTFLGATTETDDE
jgi:DNA-binding transcriptional ArsR family regulator